MKRERQLDDDVTQPRRRSLRFPVRRFRVAEASMEPTLVAGQGLVTTSLGRARPGQIRVFEHPGRPGFWLVKRVEAVDAGSMIVRSDNPDAAGAIDSRSFGPVDVDGSYRLVFAVPLRFM